MNGQNQAEESNNETGPDASPDGQEISWPVKVSLINNRFMQWVTLKVLLVLTPVLLLGLGLLFFNATWAKTPLKGTLVISGLSLVAVYIVFQLAYLLFFFNRYHKRYLLNPEGVGFATIGGTRVLISLVSILGGAAGLAGGNPGLTGSALMQSARMDRFLPWDKVRKVVVHQGPLVVSLKNSWRVLMRIYCPERRIFEEVLDRVPQYLPPGQDGLMPGR